MTMVRRRGVCRTKGRAFGDERLLGGNGGELTESNRACA